MGTTTPLSNEHVQQLVALLNRGGVLLYPTETLYGLGGNALDPGVIQRIASIKGRPSEKSFLVLMRDLETIEATFGALTAVARALAAQFWPGPLTLIIADQLRGGTIGVRLSPHPVVRQLLNQFDCPLVSTSANRANAVPSNRLEAIDPAIVAAVDAVIAEPCGDSAGQASTIVDVSGDRPILLRAGAIDETALAAYLAK